MQRPKLNRVWAVNSPMARRDPGDAKYQQGWVSEIPTYQVLNYLQYKVDTTILAQAERGVSEWGVDVSYGLGSLTWDNKTNYIYVCLVQQPDATKPPSDNPAHWGRSSIQITRKEFDDIVSSIKAHIENKANPHSLTAAQLNAYNKQEMDNLVAQYRAIVAAHVNDKSNPHGTTAEQAGGVPITGGTYEGDVTFLKSIGFNANDTARLCNENGIYLEIGPHDSDVALIGITSAGEVVAGKSLSKSPIVTESTFLELKAGQEPRYATPAPVAQMPLVADANILIGDGVLNDKSTNKVLFNGGLLCGDGSSGEYTGDWQVPFADSYTFALDVLVTKANVSSMSYRIGVDNFTMYFDGLSIGATHRDSGKTISTTVVPNKWRRYVATVDGATKRLSLYVDGVLVGGTNPTVVTNASRILWLVAYNSVNTATVKNLRIWDSCLSPEQVSTL